MPLNKLLKTALALGLIVSSSALAAMTPEIRLPEWQRSKIDISEWKPDQNLLTLRVDIEAPTVQLEKIASKLHLPEELGLDTGKHERALLKKGDRVIFMHKISIKPGFSGWAEVELSAQPSQSEIIGLIRSQHSKEPATAAILEAEALTIDKPLFFGRSMPLLVRDDIALCTAAEMTFKPDFKFKDRQFYLWYPETGFGKGLTAEGLKAFNGALAAGNFKTAESAGNMLIKKLETGNEPLTLSKGSGETFSIPAQVATSLIRANILTMQAVNAKKPSVLESQVNQMQPGYTRPFMMFNLAALYESLKNKKSAIEWYEKARQEIPAWPLAQERLDALK